MKRKLDNSLINKYPKLKSSQKDNIPQLWKDKEWAQEFANYIIDLIGNNQPPEIIEVHPPFNDYCLDFDNFFDTYIEFERIILQKYPNVKIFIENRCGTFYKGGKFLISNCKSIIKFLNLLTSLVLLLPSLISFSVTTIFFLIFLLEYKRAGIFFSSFNLKTITGSIIINYSTF